MVLQSQIRGISLSILCWKFFTSPISSLFRSVEKRFCIGLWDYGFLLLFYIRLLYILWKRSLLVFHHSSLLFKLILELIPSRIRFHPKLTQVFAPPYILNISNELNFSIYQLNNKLLSIDNCSKYYFNKGFALRYLCQSFLVVIKVYRFWLLSLFRLSSSKSAFSNLN